jgi:putative FmdB family regulatory protein
MHMPLYGYACPTHGQFEDWRPMNLSGLPAACPECGATAPRTPSIPSIRQMKPNVRIAHERNERSAEEPRVMGRDELLAAHGRLGAHAEHQPRPPGRNMYRSSVLGHAH